MVWVGRGFAVLLNRGNRQAVAGAVDAAEATAGKTVADIGFGGGLGLDLFSHALKGKSAAVKVFGLDPAATHEDRLG